MSNPNGELSNEQGIEPVTGMSEEDILKRLEPKYPEESEQEQEQDDDSAQEAAQDDAQGDPDDQAQDDQAKTEEERQRAEEDAWLAKTRKITVQGEELEVTADEAFKGYMRQQDYTRKTQEAAQLTQSITQERQFVKQEYETRINQLNSLAGVLYQELVGDQAKLAELAQTDPAQWVAKQQEMAQKSALLNQVQQHHSAIEQMKKNEADKSRVESLRENEEKLLEKLPDWRDPTKRATAQREVADFLVAQGYSPDELSDLIDHRAVVIAHKAAMWDRAQAVKEKQVKTPPTPPKAVKPGNANTPTIPAKEQRIAELAKRAKRTGNADDVAALLLARSS